MAVEEARTSSAIAGYRLWRSAPSDSTDFVFQSISPATARRIRLLLRPFQADDVSDALAYRDDPEFARFLPHIPQPFTRRDAEAFVALNMSESRE